MIFCIINNAIVRCKVLSHGNNQNRNQQLSMIPYFQSVMMIQTILLIPHMNVQMSDETISYFRAMRHLLFQFSFIPNWLQDFGQDRDNTYLYLIGIQSSENWENMLNICAIL